MDLLKFLKTFFTKRKIALVLVLCFLFSTLMSQPLFAYSTKGFLGDYHLQWEHAVYQTEEMNLQSFVFETFKATISSVLAMILPCYTCPEGGYGLFGMIGGLMAGIYAHPPASGVNYLAYMGRKLDLVPETYAQERPGVGFEEMMPYLAIWARFRDIAYAFFVLIFIVTGFAIMFRIKISPQAVITIENALPKLIIAVLLITFSYTIVGFMVDIMMVLSNLVIFTFKGIPSSIPNDIRNMVISTSITDARQFLQTILVVGFAPILISFLILLVLGGIGVGLTTLASWGGLAVPALIGWGIAALILAVVFLIAFLRLLWTLMKAYVVVVLSLIFSPFIILVGALPGSNALSGWFRNILANLAVLPTILAMVFLSGFLTLTAIFDIPRMGPLVQGYFDPNNPFDPATDIPEMQAIISNPDFVSNLTSFFVLFMVSLVILLLAPRAADIIQSFLSGQPFAWGTAITEPLRAAWVSPIGGVGRHEIGTRFDEAWTAEGMTGFRQDILRSIAGWMRQQKWIP